MAPRITIWVTDHYISQRVGSALKIGLGDEAALAFTGAMPVGAIAATPIHIGYGILRGMDNVFRAADEAGKDWFELDLGYIGPGHFHGTYRISHKGTQARFDANMQADVDAPLAAWKLGGTYALICPPTDPVQKFFGIDDAVWLKQAEARAAHLGLPAKIRRKGDGEDLEVALVGAACVITFNSSVGWQALQKGIPALSDVAHSTLGSWHGAEAPQSLDALKACDRAALFRFMAANQHTLLEIQNGQIRNILKRYVSGF